MHSPSPSSGAARGRIGVLLGGEPAPRDGSLRTGEAVVGALRARGHEAVAIVVDHDLDLVLRQERIARAFMALSGRAGGGAVQGLLETLGIPYTGSSLAAAALSADKLKAKELLRHHNLPTPSYYCHARGLGGAVEQHGGFGFPCVVKPRTGGAGAGVSVARDEEQLERAVEVALRLDDEVLVERWAGEHELQVALLDGEVLGVAQLAIADDGARVATAPRLGAERLRGVVTQALRAHHLFGCAGAVRVDVMVSERDNESILEVDAQPELGPGSIYARLAAQRGLDLPALAERILDGARLHLGRRARVRWAAGEPVGARPPVGSGAPGPLGKPAAETH